MIALDLSDKRPLYEQIVDKFKELISLGVLSKDDQMPSVRSLAMELSINPNTIQKAYVELDRSGYTYSVKGRGSFVADIEVLLPERQEKYFRELDTLLDKREEYSLTKEDIVTHIQTYDEEREQSL